MQYREVIAKNKFPLYHSKYTMELGWKLKLSPILTLFLHYYYCYYY